MGQREVILSSKQVLCDFFRSEVLYSWGRAEQRQIYLSHHRPYFFFFLITVTFTFKLKFYFEIKGHFSCREFYIFRNLLWILKHVYKFTLYHLGIECPLKQLRKNQFALSGVTTYRYVFRVKKPVFKQSWYEIRNEH